MNNNPGRIYGAKYLEYYTSLRKNSLATSPNEKLLTIVNRAIQEVPYYNKLYKGLILNSIEEFKTEIGFIDKQTIIDNFQDFINPNEPIASDYELMSTGGTTGQALKLFLPKSRQNFEVSTVHYLWNKIGYDFSTRAVIRNHRLKKNKIYDINPITREYLFDGFRINEDYFQQIYDVLKKNNINYIHAYCYNAYEFARYLIDKKLDTSFIKGFLTTSEMIYPHQTRFFDEYFPNKHYNFYGHTEKLLIGGFTAPSSNDYFFEPHYGYAELVDENNLNVNEIGQKGELIGTGFLNNGMPLIRYKTDDYAVYGGDSCPVTGKKGLLLSSILGRKAESIYNKNGTAVTTTALNLHGDLLSYFKLLQYEQHELGKLIIRVVVSELHTKQASERLLEYFKNKFNADMEIHLEYQDEINKLKNGKFLLLISTVKADGRE